MDEPERDEQDAFADWPDCEAPGCPHKAVTEIPDTRCYTHSRYGDNAPAYLQWWSDVMRTTWLQEHGFKAGYMDVEMVFDDWKDETGESIYNTPEGVELSLGDFHSGSAFPARIYLTPDQARDLRAAVKRGAQPVFWLMVEDEDA